MVVKLKKDASFIIGNGFNFYLKNYLKSEEFKIDREEKKRESAMILKYNG